MIESLLLRDIETLTDVVKRLPVKYYTEPPDGIPYPYVIVSMVKPEKMLRYIKKHAPYIDDIIVDVGIKIFDDPDVREYPGGVGGILKRIVDTTHKIYNILEEEGSTARVWTVPPDYCDDKNPRALWIDDNWTNIERTVSNVALAIEKYPELDWIIPVQIHHNNPESVKISISYYKELGIIEEFDRYAIPNPSSNTMNETVVQLTKITRKLLKNKSIHMFGMPANSLRHAWWYVDSFDNLTWYQPVGIFKKMGINWKAVVRLEKTANFIAYLDRLFHHLGYESPFDSDVLTMLVLSAVVKLAKHLKPKIEDEMRYWVDIASTVLDIDEEWMLNGKVRVVENDDKLKVIISYREDDTHRIVRRTVPKNRIKDVKKALTLLKLYRDIEMLLDKFGEFADKTRYAVSSLVMELSDYIKKAGVFGSD